MSRSPDSRIAELERVAGLIAHELKGPLVTLRGFASGLESAARAGDWDRFRGDVDRIQRLARELTETCDALLIDTIHSEEEASQETVSLQDAATDAVEMLRTSLEQQQVVVNVAPDLPEVLGSRILWRQAYRNLIDNALKACADASAPRIEIGCEHESGETICYVRDNGRGLAGVEVSRLFEPFYRHGTDAGSGLGLYFVRRLIERTGGRVWAEDSGNGAAIKWTAGN